MVRTLIARYKNNDLSSIYIISIYCLEQRREKGKKLSWMYRRKAKLRRAKSSEVKITDTANIKEQNSRIIVKNLSFKVYIYICLNTQHH